MIGALRYWFACAVDVAATRRELAEAREQLQDALAAYGRAHLELRSVRSAWSTLHADTIRLTAERDAARAELARRLPS